MNKIQAVSFALLAISSTAYATGTTSGGAATSSTVAVSTTVCDGLKEAVSIQLSANNYGEVNCPSATAAGVGVANLKGAGRSYGASSNGGALSENPAAGTTPTPFTNAAAASSAAHSRAATAAVST